MPYAGIISCAFILLAGKVCLDAAIFGSVGLGLVAGDRLGLAVSFSGYAAGVDPESRADVFLNAYGASLGKFLVIFVASDAVGMAGNFALGIGEIHEEVANGLQFVMVHGLDNRFVKVEMDLQHGRLAAESLASRCFLWGAALSINLYADWCAGALVQIVWHTIFVGVNRATV